jgi:hypothetical protein
MTTAQQSTIPWQASLDEALRRAKAESKFVLLDFFSST